MSPKKKPKVGDENDEIWKGALQADDPETSVVVAVKNNGECRALDISSESLFANMIHPIPPNVFLQHVFRKKALHVSEEHGTERIQSICANMNNLDPSFLLRETSSDNVFIWILDKQQNKIQSVEIDNVETAIALHKAGHATYCRAPPNVEQHMVANLLRGDRNGMWQL